jgi:hypothetical protein
MGVRITMFTHIGISEAAQMADLRYLCTSMRPSYSQQVWPSHPCEQNQQTSGLHSLEHSAAGGRWGPGYQRGNRTLNSSSEPTVKKIIHTACDRRVSKKIRCNKKKPIYGNTAFGLSLRKEKGEGAPGSAPPWRGTAAWRSDACCPSW